MSEQPEWGKSIAKFFILPQRVILALMGFLSIVNAYTMRSCLSITITEMVKPLNITEQKNSTDLYCPDVDDTEHTAKVNKGDYDWSELLQAVVLSSFYVGYTITHVPGGYLSQKFGGKWILSLGILSTAIFTLLTPLALDLFGVWGLITLRLFMGFGEGVTFPALSALMAYWVPVKERGTLGSLILGGSQIGTILGNAISGVILHSYKWPAVYYFWGIIAIIWFALFTVLCYTDPASHPFIKEKEKDYLMAEMGRLELNRDLPAPPYFAILTNASVLSLICAQLGHDTGYYIMVTYLPKYMSNVLKFPVISNGFLSALPFILMWILSLTAGLVTDVLIRNNWYTITTSRKVNTAIAGFIPALFLILASYAGCDRLVVVACFTLAMGAMAFYYAGMKLNPNDLSPNYAGTLMGIVNGCGAVTGIATPFLVGLLAPDATLLQWRMVFWVAFIILVVTSIIYLIWASAEVQDFDDPVALKEKKATKNA